MHRYGNSMEAVKLDLSGTEGFQKDGHRCLNMTYGSNTRGPHMGGFK